MRCYISPLSPVAPVELIFTKVDMGVYLSDVIIFTISYQPVKGFDSARGLILPFPVGR